MKPLHAIKDFNPIAAIAVAMLAVITVLRFLFDDPTVPVTLLYALPISMLALEFGFLGGGLGLAASMLLFAAWALIETPDLAAGDYVGRTAVFCATCVGIGLIGKRLAREAHGRRRWFEMSNDMLVEASLDLFELLVPRLTYVKKRLPDVLRSLRLALELEGLRFPAREEELDPGARVGRVHLYRVAARQARVEVLLLGDAVESRPARVARVLAVRSTASREGRAERGDQGQSPAHAQWSCLVRRQRFCMAT